MAPKEFTQENLKDYLAQPGIVLADFWAPWCAPCNRFAPIFEDAASRHPNVIFGKVNTDQQQDLARVFGITSLPTIIAFRDGKVVFDQPGTMTGRKIDELITQVTQLDLSTSSTPTTDTQATGSSV
ncbi:thioredoxin domain-containing protein [Jonesiaceae bacterium BS-20]|uniref:Thioredoxin domain-containing protein n=1 Tax=Jonesiaceae bacterium BS-20 TaxID=3120821 RepID=A0AAU7DTZ5_9MICO